MKNSQLNRVVRLISKTRDKAIVLDQETEEVVVMLPLESYEDMVGIENELPELPPFGPEESFTDSISLRDLADNLDDEKVDFDVDGPDFTDEHPIEPAEYEESDSKKHFSIPEKRLNFAENWDQSTNTSTLESEESLSDLPHEAEEEKFYLEPVE